MKKITISLLCILTILCTVSNVMGLHCKIHIIINQDLDLSDKNIVFWQDGDDPHKDDRNLGVHADSIIYLNYGGGKEHGYIYIKNRIEQAENNYLFDNASGTDWLYKWEKVDDLINYKAALNNNYYKSNTIQGMNNPEHVYLEIYYTKKAIITFNYEGIGKDSYEEEYVIGDQNIPAPPHPGYICKGWKFEGGEIRNLGEQDNAVVNLQKHSSITWVYCEASSVTVNTEGLPEPLSEAYQQGFNPPPGTSTQCKNESVTLSAPEVIPELIYPPEDSYYRFFEWKNATGSILSEIGETGSAPQVEFTPEEDSNITWVYKEAASVKIQIEGLPDNLQSDEGFDPTQGLHVFFKDTNVTLSVVTLSAPKLLEHPHDPEIIYRCKGWKGATGSILSEGSTHYVTFKVQEKSGLTWDYCSAAPFEVKIEGLPEVFHPIDNFDPVPGSGAICKNEEKSLTAPELIEDPTNKCFYRLVGFFGTGSVPANVPIDPNTFLPLGVDGVYTYGDSNNEIYKDGNQYITEDSSIAWSYEKVYEFKLNLEGAGVSYEDANCRICTDINNSDTCEYIEPNKPLYYPEYTSLTLQTALYANNDPKKPCVDVSGAISSWVEGDVKQATFMLDKNTHITLKYTDATRVDIGQPIALQSINGEWTSKITINGSTLTDELENSFFWDGNNLYPVRPISSFTVEGSHFFSAWPASPDRTSIVNAPVNLQPHGTAYTFRELSYSECYTNEGTFMPPSELSETPPIGTDRIFKPPETGFSVLRFSDLNDTPVFMVVETKSSLEISQEKDWEIGNAISDPSHHDPEGKNGYVYYQNAYYDGYGPDKAYDRETRIGPIIPVNETTAATPYEQRMVVVWYDMDECGIGWPVNAIRYQCRWPESTSTIIIAGGNGSRPLAEYEYTGRIYYQNDSSLPGYNPNEEHALLLGNKVFAIRNDLNKEETSKPYVLLKYRSPETQTWKMKLFKVQATGIDDDGNHHDFKYPITAGSLINPLTPMDLLPQSLESYVNDGPDWHHRDHKGSHWAKAALNQTHYEVGTAPKFLVNSDLNQDKCLDLVAVNAESDNISVLLGRGDGTFEERVNYSVGRGPQSVMVGFFDNDNMDLDLVVVNAADNTLSVLLGRGDGTFKDKMDYPAGAGLFDPNTDLDLALVNATDNTVSVLLSNGDGTFKPKVDYTVGQGPQSIAVDDLDQDGLTDLVVANAIDNTVSVLLGKGDGTFEDDADYLSVSQGSLSVVLANFSDPNDDTHLDLGLLNVTGNTFSVLLNKGDGSFEYKDHYLMAQGMQYLESDLNGNGLTDRVILNTTYNRVSVELGQNDGSFNKANYPVAQGSQSFVAGALNNDAYLDLVIMNPASNLISVLLGKIDGTFERKPNHPVGEGPHSVIMADFNGDSHSDLVLMNMGGNCVSMIFGEGDGTFKDKKDYPIFRELAGSMLMQNSVMGDFGGDPNQDDCAKVGDNFVSVQLDAEKSTEADIVMHWYYPLQKGFYYPFKKQDGTAFNEGDFVPFLNRGLGHNYPPRDVTYSVGWPSEAPVLYVGETLIESKYGLPDLVNMAAARVIFDENVYHEHGPLAKLFDPLTERSVDMPELPKDINTERVSGKLRFPDLPYSLRSRLFYDPLNKNLIFKGIFYDPGIGEPLLLLNVMTTQEKERLMAFEPTWGSVIEELFNKTRNPNTIRMKEFYSDIQNPYNSSKNHDPDDWANLWGETMLGLQFNDANTSIIPQKLVGLPMALTAGMAGGEGYLVLAENDDESLGASPVQLHIIRVAGGPYQGEIKVIKSDNPFDEKLTLRHSGDFGGEPEKLWFQWYYKPDNTGLPPLLPEDLTNADGWALHEQGPGLIDITIEGPGKLTLSDNWFMVHYYYGKLTGEGSQLDPAGTAIYPSLATDTDPNNASECMDDKKNWSKWAGAPGGQTAQLAEGWIKRVVSALNPLDARVKDFFNYETNTDVSMISQLGQRYEGDIALSASADNLNSLGLIEAYETVMNRGQDFSINSAPPVDYGPCNNALLNAATRIADFYTLLGNEAYADAQDPTIGFDTGSGELGSVASSIFAFQNQTASLLEEELVLLRGRDDSMSTTRARPVYNRLIWNYTNGDGELAYVQTYNIFDQDESGIIDEHDAKVMYPQGHGDAWGHYLTGMKVWYGLLRHKYYTWEPRVESVLVGGAPVPVDYLDERKFAKTATAKAKAGAEIVNLIYRRHYVDDPAGQWQGYKDSDTERAWGVDGWARRAGQGAYFDWVVANAMLPSEDPVTSHSGITKIDRTTVPELKAIAAQYTSIQSQADQADQGLNPLGLAKGVVTFDIDPVFLDLDTCRELKTHFEQFYDRAIIALENARTAFDYATQYTLMLRSNEDGLNSFRREVEEQEHDYWNRLIEIFGYPYNGDIGPGGTYAAGYDGPDWIHFMYVDLPDLTGEPLYDAEVVSETTNFYFNPNDVGSSHKFSADKLLSFNEKLVHQEQDPNDNWVEISYHINIDNPWMQKLDGWGKRRAPGEIQMALSELIKAHADYKRGLTELEGMIGEIQAAVDILEAKYGVFTHQIEVKGVARKVTTGLDASMLALLEIRKGLEIAVELNIDISETVIEGTVKNVGMSNDVTAPIRLIIAGASLGVNNALKTIILGTEMAEAALSFGKDIAIMDRDSKLFIDDARFEVQQMVKELECMEGDVRAKLQELYTLQEVIHQNMGRYLAALATGERLLTEREVFRKRTAAIIQDRRYQDWSFRIFRNDAVQKYRATFDLAARYAYLAATAYDYETNLLGSDTGAGRAFLTEIVRHRSPGVIMDGRPVAGEAGLADPLARISQNFAVYKTQLGFNNPQIETNRFSLRRELFRLQGGNTSDDAWRDELENYRVPDLLQFPPFKRFCRPFAPDGMGSQPGIAIPFSTEVNFGYNYFGWPLGGGDSAYDPSNFATKVRSVGVWFSGYDTVGLSSTPRIYLVPVGADVLRSPSGDGFAVRKWQVVDQKLPVPFPITASELSRVDWIPLNDTLSEEFGAIRRFSSFRAYPDRDDAAEAEIITNESTTDSRLVGRSVWNTQWLLIIPGGTMHHDPDTGLEDFITNIEDIKLFFQTYAYSGN